MECGVRSAECGVWSVECGVWSVECGVWRVEFAWAMATSDPSSYSLALGVVGWLTASNQININHVSLIV